MPLIDRNAETSWVAVLALVFVGAIGAVVFEQMAIARALAIAGVAGVAVAGLVGFVRFASRVRRLRATAPAPMLEPASTRVSTKASTRATHGVCPRCPRALDEARGAYDEHTCPARHGALLERTGSERLFERAGLDAAVVRALVGEQGTKKGTCPSCGAAMHEARLRGVVVDLCLSCGALWLDEGELEKLTNAGAFAVP